jgi:hypothetical protein
MSCGLPGVRLKVLKNFDLENNGNDGERVVFNPSNDKLACFWEKVTGFSKLADVKADSKS